MKNKLQSTLSVIREKNNIIMEDISYLIWKDFSELYSFLIKEDEEYEQRTSPLFSYIDYQMETLSSYLYYIVLVELEKKIWHLMIDGFESLLIPNQISTPYDRIELCKLLNNRLLDELVVFFTNEEEEQFQYRHISEQVDKIKQMTNYFINFDTEALILMFNKLDKHKDYSCPFNRIEIFAMLTSRQDKIAKKFVKEVYHKEKNNLLPKPQNYNNNQ